MRDVQSVNEGLKPITAVAADIGLQPADLITYGEYKAKIRLDQSVIRERRVGSRYVVVTSVNPTPLGEGKTTTAIGLAQACLRIGVRSIVTIRQPSLGPLFGIKGGGAGGGLATLEPMTDLNLHLTGDAHAVTAAHNLCSAYLDNHLHHGNEHGFDLEQISWRRVLDVNDRALRSTQVGRGKANGPERATGFDITAASEVMSILSISRDWQDLRCRLGRIVIGYTVSGQPITADDISAGGGMAVLLRDALQPNLLQTQEGTPAIVHSGPFGNIALGNSSLIADRIALGLSDIVITEAGFGADLGAEKFFNVKCREGNLVPDVAVVVVTVRSLKAHDERFTIVAGKPLDPRLEQEDLEALETGLPNLAKHIENVLKHGVRAVVAINGHPTDSPREIARITEFSLSHGADACAVSQAYSQGGAGVEELAREVLAAAERPSSFRYLYDLDSPVRQKIETIAREMYGAGSVSYLERASDAIDRYEALGFGTLPICMAKTPVSLTGDPTIKGRPEGFELHIREVRLAAGAGYLIPLAGSIMLMPGLGKTPGGVDMDLLPDGTIVGVS